MRKFESTTVFLTILVTDIAERVFLEFLCQHSNILNELGKKVRLFTVQNTLPARFAAGVGFAGINAPGNVVIRHLLHGFNESRLNSLVVFERLVQVPRVDTCLQRNLNLNLAMAVMLLHPVTSQNPTQHRGLPKMPSSGTAHLLLKPHPKRCRKTALWKKM